AVRQHICRLVRETSHASERIMRVAPSEGQKGDEHGLVVVCNESNCDRRYQCEEMLRNEG
ncbi:MAG: hypothetical protein PHO54_01770, partial [Candidatus Peribacteraceae bacterium]|nr:hypothetical protein [Candidatus Peribacteraceae bacterium]